MSARSGGKARQGALGLMALVACGPLWAADGDEEAKAMTQPPSTLGAGIGYVSKDNTRFGQYNGLNKQGLYDLLDLDLRHRNDETGTWLNLLGRNIGLDSNELRFEHSKQGSWGYFVEYSELPRVSPYTPVTTLAGAGTANQVVNGTAIPQQLDVKTVRKNTSGGIEGRFDRNYTLALRFSTEDKEGSRLFGRSGSGTTGSFQEFLAEPINYTTNIWELAGGFTGEKLQLNVSYLNTNFSNNNMRLDVSGSPSTFSPIALPPDNQSQQLSVAGGYTFSQATRATFKVARTDQTQFASFIDTPSVPRVELGGKVVTTFMQGGVSSRLSKDLNLVANLRYENRDDQTPVADYFNITTTNTATGENEPRSIKTLNGKVEAAYRLRGGYTAVAGVDYDEKTRNTSDVRVVSFRRTTDETSTRLELRRMMSETVNGSIAYIYSQRTGSPWETTVTTAGTPGSNLVAPLQLADRDRQMLRLRLGWTATERLDVQFVGDLGKDDYGGRTLGLSDGSDTHFALDASYRLTDLWRLSAWISQDDLRSKLNSCENASATGVCPDTAADPVWQANIKNVSNALGIGVRGQPATRFQLGADVQYQEDIGKNDQGPLPAGIAPLTDIVYRRTTFKLWGKQDIDKRFAVRAQYVFDRFQSNDFTWANWVYGDGTVVLPNPNQKVNFIALQLEYRL
jgi:MtrB/PioB family decaheme-associated outer membrane protein